MPEKPKNPPKTQVNLEEYMKTKDARSKDKLKLRLPTLVKVLIAFPVAYILFLVIYFLANLRFLPEH